MTLLLHQGQNIGPNFYNNLTSIDLHKQFTTEEPNTDGSFLKTPVTKGPDNKHFTTVYRVPSLG